VFKNMAKSMTISAFYSRVSSKSMTHLMTILTCLIAKFLMWGPSSYKSYVKLRRFIQIETSLFKNNLLNSSV
jgi:predicted membrane protein